MVGTIGDCRSGKIPLRGLTRLPTHDHDSESARMPVPPGTPLVTHEVAGVSPAASGTINPSVDGHRYRLRSEHGKGAADDQMVQPWLAEAGTDCGSCDSIGSPKGLRFTVLPPTAKAPIVEHRGVKVAAGKRRDAPRDRAARTQECKVVLLVPVGSDLDWCRTANGQLVRPACDRRSFATARRQHEDSHPDSDGENPYYGAVMQRATSLYT